VTKRDSTQVGNRTDCDPSNRPPPVIQLISTKQLLNAVTPAQRRNRLVDRQMTHQMDFPLGQARSRWPSPFSLVPPRHFSDGGATLVFLEVSTARIPHIAVILSGEASLRLILEEGTHIHVYEPRVEFTRAIGVADRCERRSLRYDRARGSLDRHATYNVATFVAGASR